jgi:hypothetical protein
MCLSMHQYYRIAVMRRRDKNAYLTIIGLILVYFPIKWIGDVVERSDLPIWITYPIYFLLGAVSFLIIWIAVKRL